MLIEPTPALSPSGGARRRRLAALSLPIVALAVVTAVGWLAGGGEAGVPQTGGPTSSAPPDGGVAASAAPSAVAASETASFPARALGLPVRTVADMLARRQAGDLGDEIVAVAGYLTVLPGPDECLSIPDAPTTQASSPCGSDTIVAESPGPLIEWSEDGFAWRGEAGGPAGVHLHATAFPTTDIGALAGRSTMTSPSSAAGVAIVPVATIVLGRFGDPRVADRRSNLRHPNLAFVIEAVAWLDGTWQGRTATRYAHLPPDSIAIEEIRANAAAAFPGGAEVIGHAFVDLATLGQVDASALGAVRSGAVRLGVEEPLGVWYVRVIRREGDSAPLARDAVQRRLRWVVLGADGTVLGSAIDR